MDQLRHGEVTKVLESQEDMLRLSTAVTDGQRRL
jgi:hypothetical protein